MRKIKLQMQLSVDGFVAGMNGEQDWMQWNWGEDIKQYVANLTDSIDTILMGRVLYEGMSSYWPDVEANSQSANEDVLFARTMNNLKKIVFSRSLETVTWNNTRLEKGDLLQSIRRLKQQSGKDIIVYGGVQFVSSLIQEKLIDEFHLFINPVLLGKGLTIFSNITQQQPLKLSNSQSFDCGIVLQSYIPLH